MATGPQSATAPEPTIHAAELASGPDGAVEWGAELTFAEAVARRRQGLDIVVRGPDERQNRRKASAVETAVGTPILFERRHPRAGPFSLPHYHQASRSPAGHSFYEVRGRKARKKP
jgi:hypothetical protein